MYSTIIFDLDGTLLDTRAGALSALKKTLHILSLQLDEKYYMDFLKPPMKKAFVEKFSMNKEEANNAMATFNDIYCNHYLLYAKPYDNIKKLLKAAGNANLFVATYKQEDAAQKLLEHFGLANYFSGIYGSVNNGLSKKDIINKKILINRDKMHTLLVGDSPSDALAAEETGIDFLAVLYGYGFFSCSELKQFSHIGAVNNINEIAAMLNYELT